MYELCVKAGLWYWMIQTPRPPKSCIAKTVWVRVTTFINHVDVWTL